MKINKRYQTHPVIKSEMLKLLKWARDNDIHQLHETPEKKLDEYLTERDIAIQAQSVSVLEKVSTRNAVKETILAAVCLVAGILFVAVVGVIIQIYQSK